MCLIVFDWQPDTTHGPVLTLAANRDEFFRRTSAPLAWWSDAPHVLAGRDLEGGGTWLGVARDGRFAALTNYRAPFDIRAGAPTRGKLVSGFLTGENVAPLDYLANVAEKAVFYNGFTLLAGDGAPFVAAHRIAPLAARKGVWQAMRRLRTRPLAELLYSDPEVTRSALVSRRVLAGHPLFSLASLALARAHATEHAFAARRSVFERRGTPLMVTECMLPALWRHLDAHGERRARGLEQT